MPDNLKLSQGRLYKWLIRVASLLVPRASRSDWRQEWLAEIQHRMGLLAEWRRTDFGTSSNLFRRSLGAFPDAFHILFRQFADGLLQDLRYGARMLRRQPAFTVAAIATLALGIGVNTVIFSAVREVLLRPFPFKQQDRLAVAWKSDPAAANPFVEFSYPDFIDLRDQMQSFEQLTAMPTTVYGYGLILTGAGDPVQLESARVSSSFFEVLGASSAMGRTFLPEEDQPGIGQVVVLSHTLWRERFGKDPTTVGKSLTLSGKPYTIVGVMPADFDFPRGAELWAPLAPTMPNVVGSRGAVFLQAVGRMKPGVTVDRCRAEMSTVLRRLDEQYHDERTGVEAVVVPLDKHILGNTPLTLYLLLAASGLVLLIACTNLANLLLARAASRHKEIGVRLALGAGRTRLVRQLLTESVMLALMGGAIGLILAIGGVSLLIRFGPADIPRLARISIDTPVLGFTLGLALMTAVLFGLMPALGISKATINDAIRHGGERATGPTGRSRLRNLLVVSELAATTILLIAAGLMLRSYLNLQRTALGFDRQGLVTMRLALPGWKYPGPPERRVFFMNLIQQLEFAPGVKSAAGVLLRPLEGLVGWDTPFQVEGQPAVDALHNPNLNFEAVTPGYFLAMGIPILQGRDFTEQDAMKSPLLAIVSKSMAERFWPAADPIGKRFQLGSDYATSSPRWLTVVAVAGDARYRELQDIRLDVYVSFLQSNVPVNYLVVRASDATQNPLQMVPAIQATIATLDRDQPVTAVATMEDMVSVTLARPRFNMFILSLFASLAAVLACNGIYGVIAYSVAERTREIGIRLALGAEPRKILTLIVKHTMGLSLVGVALGMAGGLAGARAMSSLLFAVSPMDAPTLGFISALLLAVAFLACYLPSRRVARVDPVEVLRSE